MALALMAQCLGATVSLKRCGMRHILTTLGVGAAFICADLVFEFYTQIFPTGDSIVIRTCARVPWRKRAIAIVEGVLIRTWSQAGRLCGHLQRSRFMPNYMRRFNWFGRMWPGYAKVERRRAAAMWVFRIAFAAASIALLAGQASLSPHSMLDARTTTVPALKVPPKSSPNEQWKGSERAIGEQ